uniref:uncharacterized protein LOC124014400 n=1 Tax=Oncorhynchus gorbuscha TaxID=8017 RepID=UPI001EAF8A33|nr:uncharacterized protein LOC124014400 [Oncorhynchus gorbuscha]
MYNACENARSREWSDGDGYSCHSMAHWASDPPAGERQYLTQQAREHQWLNREDEAAVRAHYNSHQQNSQMDFHGHRTQETQPPPPYHQDHHRSQNIRDRPNLYGPLREPAPPNVTLHCSGERTVTWANHEPHFPSNDFLPPLNFERGHEDISHHHNTDQDYLVGRGVNHNNLHYLESKWQMFDPTHSNGHARGHCHVHSRGHFTECSRGHSRGGSCGNSRGGSSVCSWDGSRGRSSGRSRGGSRGQSSGRSWGGSRGQSSGRSRGGSRGQSSGRSRAHSKAASHGILGPSVPSQALTQKTDNLPGNVALVSHTQTSVTTDQQYAPSPPKPLTETLQEKPPHKHKISLNEIQDWLHSVLRSKNGPINGNNSTQDPSQAQQFSTEKMDILQAGKRHLHSNTKDNQASPPERFSPGDSTIRLEIKSTPRCMTLTAVATTPPPVAIVPPMGPQQSPEPMETENTCNELPFKILRAWSINEQQVESLWERAKDDASSLSVRNEPVQVESFMEYDKPVDASATSSLASTGEDNDEVLQVITQTDKSSPSPYVHTIPQATDVVRTGGTQTIVEVSSNGADERSLVLSTIAEVQFKLRTLQQLVSYREKAATITEAKDGCLEAILEQYWGGETSNLVEALKDKRDKEIMRDVSAWAAEDEEAVVLFAVSGISLGEVVEKFPIQAHVDSSSQVGYRSSWLNVNEKLNDIDKESGRAWSLWFIPDKAEESSKVVGGVKMDDTFHSKMETVEFPARQPVEATDSDLKTNIDLMVVADSSTGTDLPTDADSETESLFPMILTVLTPEDAVKLLAETEAPGADLTTDSNCPTNADLTTDSDTDPLSPMHLTVLTSEDAMRLFCQIENGSDLQLGSHEPCSEDKDEIKTKQPENIESGSLDKSCYCPCIIETDNGFESGLCSSCQRERGLQQGTRCLTIAQCFTLLDTSDNSDQETEEVPKDSGGKATGDNQCRDKKQTQSTEEEGDDNQSCDNKTEGEMQQCTGVIPITDFFFWSDTIEDSDQETEENPNEQHAQIEAHASNVKRTEPETDAKAPCESAQEHTTQSKVSPGSEDREMPQEKDQDCRTSTLPIPKFENPSKLRANIIADKWCSPVEDCGSPAEKYDKVADFVTQYKTCNSKKKVKEKMEKEKTLHPTSSDRQKPKKRHGRAERGQSPSQPPKSSGVKATLNNQRRDKKPHASHKRRHLTESDESRCKDEKRGSSTEKEREGSQSRDNKPPKRRHSTEKESEDNQSRGKKGRLSMEQLGEASQSRDKTSQKGRNSTKTESRNSKEFQCQLVESESDRGSKMSPPCPGVKTLHVLGSSSTTDPLKLSLNIRKKPSTNGSPSTHTEEVPKRPKTKTTYKTSRHHSPAMSVSPVVKERQRNGVKHKQKIKPLKVRLKKLSLPKQIVRKVSPPRQKRVEDRGDPPSLGVMVSKNPDSCKKLKHKAESDLASQQMLSKIPKVLNRNETGKLSKSKRERDSLPHKPKLPRILKLLRTPEVSKDGNERANREETSPSASPESQMLNKPARVAHKPKPCIKPASPNGYSPGSHACSNPARISQQHGNGHFGAKVTARQQVFSDWESSFVPTPTPRTRRRSGCPPEEVEGPQASPRCSSETRIIPSILKRVDSLPKPKRNVSFPLDPMNVHYYNPCEYENHVMFNRSYTDPEDAQPSDDEEEDASVNCQNLKEQSPLREEKQQDVGELKPGPSAACEKSFKRKREMQEPAAILMKKSIVQAKHLTKSLHHEPPKDSRHSARKTGVGYKWSEKQRKRANETEGTPQNASLPHGHHPGSSRNASPHRGYHSSSSQGRRVEPMASHHSSPVGEWNERWSGDL